MPALFLLLLVDLDDPETTVTRDITKVSSLTVDGCNNDALTRMALVDLPVTRAILIIGG